ncbi:hypothetical protein APHAL10511_004658 [Amanita phalloides]|nr:hypothetical protein APHAL10511_004658 [Amanita phalloides]
MRPSADEAPARVRERPFEDAAFDFVVTVAGAPLLAADPVAEPLSPIRRISKRRTRISMKKPSTYDWVRDAEAPVAEALAAEEVLTGVDVNVTPYGLINLIRGGKKGLLGKVTVTTARQMAWAVLMALVRSFPEQLAKMHLVTLLTNAVFLHVHAASDASHPPRSALAMHVIAQAVRGEG